MSTPTWTQSPWVQKLKWILQIGIDFASGMQYLHGKKIVHRDLNSTNLLVENRGKKIYIYICDFGASGRMNEDPNDITGSIYYMAPELLKNHSYTFACDVYSFGCVLWELVTESIPHQSYRDTTLKTQITNGEYKPIQELMNKLIEKKTRTIHIRGF